MSDEEINADNGAALPGDTDDDSWVQWQAMDTYQDGQVALTHDGDRQVFGVRRDGVWHEMVDADEHAVDGYEPTAWTMVPPEKWADWALG